ncbi:MAG: efflux RND transporter periplasmic adaptor subunit [Betaproteobacteria bacterium]|nr:efflux RND transporter periplasmic adaptor subunit [Betaproteobacteria bacterium]
MNKAVAVSLVTVALASALGAGYWMGRSGTPAPAAGASKAGAGPAAAKGGPGAAGTPVEVTRATPTVLPSTITAIGSLKSDESVSIRPEVSGRISEILFREGQAVEQGAVLVRLDASVQRAEVQQAEANLSLAKTRLDRARDLFSKNFISAQARDEAESNFKVAQAAYDLSAARLTKLEIRAPFSGLVGLRLVSIGDYIKDGQDIANLEGIDTLKVDFRVPEVYLKKVNVDQGLQVTLDALPGATFTGRVFAINPLVDAGGRAIVVRAVVKNTDKRLRPGMFARVRLLTDDKRETLALPEQSLVPSGDEFYVFKVVDGRAVRTKVEIGQRQQGLVEIVGGLTAGEVIVTAGQIKIRDGAQVKVSTEPGAPAATAIETPPARATPTAPAARS